jgi:hypothetical protein
MDHISDYLDWRGDVPFSVSPFNEVDNYIVAKIGCCDFDGIVPEEAECVGVGAALTAFFERCGSAGVYFGALASPSLVPLLRRLPETPRFRDLSLGGFVRRALPECTEQFSALTVSIPDGTHYISFRGTDDTLYAWKEDCMMALSGAIPAQRDAADYLAWAASAYDGTLRVGGHSKGGNLAVYAAAQAESAVQERIAVIYNNDGPGFDAAFLSSPGYLRIREKLLPLIPQYSIVGTLLEQDTNCVIIRSSRFGIAAHDGFNWGVRGTQFLRCQDMSRSSRAFDATMERVLGEMDMDQRREFIDTFFRILSATGAVTLTDINERRLRKALSIARGMAKEKTVSRFVADVIEQMAKEYVAVSAEALRERLPHFRHGKNTSK